MIFWMPTEYCTAEYSKTLNGANFWQQEMYDDMGISQNSSDFEDNFSHLEIEYNKASQDTLRARRKFGQELELETWQELESDTTNLFQNDITTTVAGNEQNSETTSLIEDVVSLDTQTSPPDDWTSMNAVVHHTTCV